MKKNTQIILYSLLGVATIVGVYFLVKKPKDDTDTNVDDKKPEVDEQKVPDKNLEELLGSNSLKKGTKIFTKVDNVKVRDSRAVDNAFPTNIYGEVVKKGTLLGNVTSTKKMADGFTWIGVRLTNEAYNEIQDGKSFITRDLIKQVPAEKFVREDVVKV
jgi:hypothetical protein